MRLCLILFILASGYGACLGDTATYYEDHPSIQLFREYLRINTAYSSEGSVDYSKAVEFWKRQAESVALKYAEYEVFPGKPIVVLTWNGTDPSLPAIMLNSHMDVVPAEESDWTYPPFEAQMDDEGNIYGRGTQDMKSVAIQYLEAIRKLKANNVTLTRTIHMTMMPDEEIGGHEGMQAFVKTKEFSALNIGFALDEGVSNPNNTYAVFYADRTPWQIVINCTGVGGHGSTMPDDIAAIKFRNIVDSFLDYRKTQSDIMKEDPSRQIGSVTSINLTKVSGGTATNIIPTSLSATFDMRLAYGINTTAFNQTISKWIADAGEGCTHYYLRYEDASPATVLDQSNIYWIAFKKATDDMKLMVKPIICPGTTDSIYLRPRGVHTIGFSPITATPVSLHASNERLSASEFLRGIDIYYNIISAVANA